MSNSIAGYKGQSDSSDMSESVTVCEGLSTCEARGISDGVTGTKASQAVRVAVC